jgi:Holliday junction DNA helicase RuvA
VIAQLTGRIIEINWDVEQLVLEVNGVGFGVYSPRSTLEQLPGVGEQARLYTHLYVRDDALELYGFLTEAERQLFRLLLGVSKVGPKLGLAVLSGYGVEDFRRAVQLEDVTMLTEVRGIGQKTAERLILELRDKLGTLELTETAATPAAGEDHSAVRAEAEEALQALGYQRSEAMEAVKNALSELDEPGSSVEELVKLSLRKLGSDQASE